MNNTNDYRFYAKLHIFNDDRSTYLKVKSNNDLEGCINNLIIDTFNHIDNNFNINEDVLISIDKLYCEDNDHDVSNLNIKLSVYNPGDFVEGFTGDILSILTEVINWLYASELSDNEVLTQILDDNEFEDFLEEMEDDCTDNVEKYCIE